jgi:hypothetical protein
MTHTSGQRPAAQSNQDGVERRHGLHQFQADGRRTLAGLDVEAVFDQPDAVVARDGHRPLAGHVEVDLHQLQPGVQCADAIKLDRRSKAGCDDGDIDSPGATGPSESLAKVTRAGAHERRRASVGKKARDYLCAAGLEAADRVRGFELDAHRATKFGLH